MKIPGNYHTHTRYDDGRGDPEDYVRAALARGLTHLGFSGHAPLPFETTWNMKAELFDPYKREILSLRDRYAGRLDILLGLEVDYISGVMSPRHPEIQSRGLDYTLGSVHYLGGPGDGIDWTVDGAREELEAGVTRCFGGSFRRAVERYYDCMDEMLTVAPPDIVAHFDLIKKNNRAGDLFSEDEPWYRERVGRSLEVVRGSGSTLEVNTGGLARNTSGALYPSEWILAECVRLGIPLVVDSDAHRPEGVDALFAEAAALLERLNATNVRALTRAGWIRVPLSGEP